MKRCSETITGSVFSSSLQEFMMKLISMLLLFDEISSLSCLWGPRKSPVKAQRQEIWLLEKVFHLQKITVESFSRSSTHQCGGTGTGEALAVP